MPSTISNRRGSSAMHLELLPPKPARFTKFRDLPAELRALIWQMALPGPRIILLEHKRLETQSTTDTLLERVDRLGFRSDSAPPTILFANHEACEIASRRYTQAFRNRRGSSVAETYIDFKKDTLYLGPEWLGPGVLGRSYGERIHFVLQNELHPDDLMRVENLAVWWDNFYHLAMGMEVYLAGILGVLGNVKSVTIVSKKYCMPGFRDTYPKMHGELKFLENMTEVTAGNIQIQGVDIPSSKSWMPNRRIDVPALENVRASPTLFGLSSPVKQWETPQISYNVITTPHGEELLLQEAKDAKAAEFWGS